MNDDKIYRALLGNECEVGEMYISRIPPPHRKHDTNCSFGLYVEDDGIIRWKDFGLSDQQGFKAVNLIQYMRNLPLGPGVGYYKAKAIAEGEFEREFLVHKLLPLEKRKRVGGMPFLKWRELNDFELNYWNRYGITKEDLQREDIWGLESLQWGSGIKTISSAGNPAFVYIFNRNPLSFKVYRPLDKDNKFRQWSIDGVVEGSHILKQDNRIYDVGILVSSTKDRIVCKKAFPDWLFLNPTAEGTYISLISRWMELKPRALRWCCMYDSDEAGYSGGEMISNHLSISNIDMRNKLNGQKDFSDYIDTQKGKHSYNELKTIINNNLKQ